MTFCTALRCFLKNKMSYTPMSDLGQQGLFDITRTLLQQPDLASLCEALSQLVKRSALADNAAIVLWQAQTQRASYYASREKDTPLNMKTKLFWHTVRYAAFCRALIRCIAVTKNFVKHGRSWSQVGYTPNLVTIA